MTLAQPKAVATWTEQLEAWEARDSEEAEKRHASAQAIAQIRGFRYLQVAQVADLPRRDLLERIEAIPDDQGTPGKTVAAAMLGSVPVSVMPELARCVVAMEACGGAHFWGRKIGKWGHEVRLIPPAYVKPFVKRLKRRHRRCRGNLRSGGMPVNARHA